MTLGYLKMVTIDKAHEMLNEIAEDLPREVFKELNGGIILLEEVKKSPYAIGDDLYVLGEYLRSPGLGKLIKIYYGSFKELFPDCSEEFAYKKLKGTLLHELTHHLEYLAGEDSLEKWDAEQLEKYLGTKTKTYF